MSDSSTPLVLLVGALPALAGLLNALWPTDRRGLAGRLRRALEIREKLPPGRGRDDLDGALGNMARQLAYAEDARLRRRIDGANAVAMVVVGLVGVGLFGFLWQFDNVVVRIIAVALATFIALLVFIGGGSRFVKDAGYPWEREPSGKKTTS